MFQFIKKYFSKPAKKNSPISSNQDVEMAFKLHKMVSAINNSSSEDKIKSLETLRQAGHISEAEFQKAKNDLSTQA